MGRARRPYAVGAASFKARTEAMALSTPEREFYDALLAQVQTSPLAEHAYYSGIILISAILFNI